MFSVWQNFVSRKGFFGVLFLIVFSFILTPTFSAFAVTGVPATMSYQGRLANSAGDLVGGAGAIYSFKFSLWDNATVGAGSQVWPAGAPTAVNATVRQGLFNVNIGDTGSGYPDALNYDFSQNNKIYLQVEVSSDGLTYETLGPRQPITSAPFAQVAGQVSGSAVSTMGGLVVNGGVTSTHSTTTGSGYFGTALGLAGQYINSWSDLATYLPVVVGWSTSSDSTNFATLLAGTTTDALAEGVNHKYYSNVYVADYISSSSTLASSLNYWAKSGSDLSYTAGNVGVGMSPVYKLDVNGAIRANGSNIIAGGGSVFGWIFGSNGLSNVDTTLNTSAGYNILFKNGTSEQMRISSGGLVGIGTTTPTQRLDVLGNIQVNGTSSYMINGVNLAFGSTTKQNYFFGAAGNSNITGSYNTGVGKGALVTTTSGGYNTAVGRQSLYLNTIGSSNTALGNNALQSVSAGDGNVGLGADAGQYELGSNSFYLNNIDQNDTAGDKAYSLLYGKFSGVAGSLTNQFLTVNGKLNIGTTTMASTFNIQGISGVSALNIASSTGAPMFTVASNGNVGIGTNAPAYPLDVNGNAKVNGVLTVLNGTSYGILAGLSKLNLYDNAGNASYQNSYTGGWGFGIGNISPTYTLDVKGSGAAGGIFNVASSSGVSALMVSNNGNVGIGTNAPSTGLHLYDNTSTANKALMRLETTAGSGQNAGIRMIGGASNADWMIGTNRADLAGAGDSLLFYKSLGTAGTKMVIQDNGNVGIGTTSPATALHVYGATPEIRLDASGSVNAQYTLNQNNVKYGLLGLSLATDQLALGSAVGDVVLRANAGQKLMLSANGSGASSTMTLLNGLVGIGTTTPSSLLHLYGSSANPLILERNSSLANVGIQFKDTSGSWYAGKGTGTGNFAIGTDANLGASTIFNIQSNGNVGIGTSSPANPLTVADKAQIGTSITNTSQSASLVVQGTASRAAMYIQGDASRSASTDLIYSVNRYGVAGGFQMFGDHSMLIGSTGKEFQYQGSTGYVGIGTTSPSQLLTVGNNNQFTVTSGGAVSATGGFSTNGTVNAGYYQLGGIQAFAYSGTQVQVSPAAYWQSLGLFTNGSEKVSILSNGNVGIGTTTPWAKLSLQNSYGSTGALLDIATTTSSAFATSSVFYVGSNGYVAVGTNNPTNLFEVDVGGVYKVAVNAGGTFVAKNDVMTNLIGDLGSKYQKIMLDQANGLRFFAGSSASNEYMRINQSGLVGIGTTSPMATLSVMGTSTLPGVNPFVVASSSGVQLLTVLPNGNVGVGTTNPSAKLTAFSDATSGAIGDTLRVFSGLGSVALKIYSTTNGDGLIINQYYQGSGQNYIRMADIVSNSGDTSEAQIRFLTKPNSANPSEAMRITGSGFVGIGTTSPALKLHVLGTIGLPATSGTAQNGVARFSVDPAGTGYVLDMGVLSGASWLQTTIAGDLGTYGSLLLNPRGGNIGIGTATPGKTLDVNGDIRIGVNNKLYLVSTNDSNYLSYNEWNTASSIGLKFLISGNEKMRIDASGNVAIGTSTPWAKLAIQNSYGSTQALFDIATTTSSAFATSSVFYVGANGNVGIGTANPAKRLSITDANTALSAYALNISAYKSSGNFSGLSFGDDSGGTVWGAIKFKADTNNDSSLRFLTWDGTTGGTERLTIKGVGGSVGIGSTSPISTLSVKGVAGYNPFTISSSTDASLLTILQNGNVGIGTSSPATSLDVYSNTTDNIFRLMTGPAIGVMPTFTMSQGGTNNFQIGRALTLFNPNLGGIAAENDVGFSAPTNRSLYFGTAANPYLAIRNGGNVGIGTTSPPDLLTVYHDSSADTVLNISNNSLSASYGSSVLKFSQGNGEAAYISWNQANQLFKFVAGRNNFNNFSFNTVTGGAEVSRLFIQNNGNVGIGSTSPMATLSVMGTSTLPGVNPFVVASSSGAQLLTVLPNGKVGIGTTGPVTKLSLSDATSTFLTISNTNNASGVVGGMLFSSQYESTYRKGAISFVRTESNANRGYLSFALDASNTASNVDSDIIGNTKMVIDYTGSVGIGTTAPGAKLDIVGVNNQLRITNADGTNYYSIGRSNSNGYLEFSLTGANSYGYTFNGGLVGIGTTSPMATLSVMGTSTLPGVNPFVVASSSGAQLLTVLPSGNVGIGISNPAQLLDVEGRIRANTLEFGANNSYLGYLDQGGLVFNSSGVGTIYNAYSGSNLFLSSNGGNVILGMRDDGLASYNGKVGIGTSTPFAKLAIQNSFGSTQALFDIATTTSSAFATSSVFYVGANGNVGVGTNLPTNKFTVSGTVDPVRFHSTGQNVLEISSTGNSENGVRFTRSGDASYWTLGMDNNSTNDFYLGSSGFGTKYLTVLQTNGNVGIGTTTPISTLSVSGTAGINPFTIASSTGQTMLTMLQNGNVGIGTANPISPLTISKNSATTATWLNLDNTDVGGAGVMLDFTQGGGMMGRINSYYAGNGLWNLGLGTNANSGLPVLFVTNGRVGVASTTPQSTFAVSGIAGTNPFTIASSTGQTMLTMLQNGNVGIGTAAPSYPLDVVANSSGSNLNLINNPSNLSGIRFGVNGTPASSYTTIFADGRSTGYLYIKTNDIERFRIDSNGNVGIGTTTPSDILSIQGNSSILGNTPSVGLNNTDSGGRLWSIYSSGNSNSIGGGKFSIFDKTASLNRLVIDSSGNVGIGTSSPQSILHLYGATVKPRLERSVSSGAAVLDFWPSGTLSQANSVWSFGMVENNSNFSVNQWTGSQTLQRLLVDTNGNVGIGTTSPAATLDIEINNTSGASTIPVFRVGNLAGTPAYFGITLGGSASGWENIAQLQLNGTKYISLDGGQSTVDLHKNMLLDNNVSFQASSNGFNNFVPYNTAFSNGFSFDTGSIFSFQTNGSPVMTILNNGNVGIGSTTPLSTLSVSGTAGTNPFTVASSTGNAMLTMLQNGNVGIGTANPGNKLHIVGGGLSLGDSVSALTTRGLFNIHDSSNARMSITKASVGGFRFDVTGSGSSYRLNIGDDNVANSGDTNAWMTFTNLGLVGLGTTTPNANLNIFGTTNTFMRVASSTNQNIFVIDNNGDVSMSGGLALTGLTGNIITSTNVKQAIQDLDTSLYNQQNNTKEITGFPNRTDTSIAFTSGTRTFTITGTNFKLYSVGKEYTKNTESIGLPNTVGLYYIYYDKTSHNLATSTTAWGLTDGTIQVATVYWDGTTGVLGEERHGVTMDGATHEYLHHTVGTRYQSGLAGTFNSDRTFSITAGAVDDEDIEETIPLTTTGRILYHNGPTNFTYTSATSSFFDETCTGGVVCYDNAGTKAAVTNNNYVAYWIFATNDPTTPIYSMMGQRQDTSLANAQANQTYGSLTLGTLPFAEMKLLYRVIVRNNAGSTLSVDDYRSVSNLPSGTYLATLHSSLTGLTNDDHTQYALLAGRAGGQSLIGGNTAGDNLTLFGNSIDYGNIFTQPYGGSLTVGTTSTITLANTLFNVASSTGANYLTVLKNGNVGIGTSSPSTNFYVQGNSEVTGYLIAGGAYSNADTVRISLDEYTDRSRIATAGYTNKYYAGRATGVNGEHRFYVGANGSWNEALSILSSGSIGIGTTTPLAKLDLTGTLGSLADIFNVSTSTGANLVSSLFRITANGDVSIGGANLGNYSTTTINNDLVVGGGALTYSSSTGIVSIDNVELGATSFPTDAGMVSWMDMPLTSGTAAGVGVAYTANLAGNPILSIAGISDGNGDLSSFGVGIGTTSVPAFLTIQNASTTSNMPLLLFASSSGSSILSISNNGNIGIGTSTSGGTLHVINPTGITSAKFQAGTGNTITNSLLEILPNSGLSKIYFSSDNNGQRMVYLDTTGSPRMNIDNSSIVQGSNRLINWTSGDMNASADIGLSRGAAGKLYVGNGATYDYTGGLIAGSVGIGSSTPVAKLSIHDNSGLAASNPLFTIASSSAAGTGTTTLLTILGNGNLGIGTASPNSPLQISNTTATTKFIRVGTNSNPSTTANAGGIVVDVNGGGGVYMGDSANGLYGKYEAYGGKIGIGSMSNHPVGLFTNSVERLSITNGGLVGIGTTTPSAKFSIQNAFGATGALFDIATTTSSAFATSSLFTVLANGNVGIGTNNPTLISGGSGLHIKNSNGEGNLRLDSTVGNNQQVFELRTEGTVTGFELYDITNGKSKIWVKPNNGDIMLMNSNVGIGTTSPIAKLSVIGNTYLGGNLTATGTLDVAGTTTIPFGSKIGDVAGSNYVTVENRPFDGTYASGSIPLIKFNSLFPGDSSVGGIDRSLIITASGGVSPSLQFAAEDFADTANVGKIIYDTHNNRMVVSDITGTGAVNSVDLFIPNGNVTINGLNSNGAVYSNGGLLTNTNPSSRDYKKNIIDTNLNLDALLGLQVKSFVWKNNGQSDFGLIAEEVKSALPELYVDDGKTKGYRADHLPFYLLQIAQRQEGEINSLNEQITSLLGASTSSPITLTEGGLIDPSLLAVSSSSLAVATTTAETSTSTAFSIISDRLLTGVGTVKELVSERMVAMVGLFDYIKAKVVETDTLKVQKGMEIKDSATGDIYCVLIVNGEWQKTKGKCSDVPVAPTTPSTPTSPAPADSSSGSSTPSTSGDTSTSTPSSDTPVITTDSSVPPAPTEPAPTPDPVPAPALEPAP